MVLCLKARESRSPPGLPVHPDLLAPNTTAGWSSPVARQAHNLKVRGSNPLPATNVPSDKKALFGGLFCCPRRAPRHVFRLHSLLLFRAIVRFDRSRAALGAARPAFGETTAD